MNRFRVAVAVIVLAGGVAELGFREPEPRPAAQPAGTNLESADVFAPFVGEWTIDGAWDSGEPLHARNVYAWGLAKKYITAKTFVTAEGKEYQRYDGTMMWHTRKKTLAIYSFAFNGDVSEHRITTKDGRTLEIGFSPWDSDDPGNVRQTLRLDGDDAYVWTVEIKNDGKWSRLIEGTWRRKR